MSKFMSKEEKTRVKLADLAKKLCGPEYTVTMNTEAKEYTLAEKNGSPLEYFGRFDDSFAELEDNLRFVVKVI